MLARLVPALEAPLPRTALAALVALLAVLVVTPLLAAAARRRRFGDRDDKSDSDTLNALHKGKRSTPIVGGIAMLAGTALATLLLADLTSVPVLALLGAVVGLGALGVADDWQKTFGQRRTRGLSARQKLVGQVVVAVAVAGALLGQAAWGAPGAGPDLALLTRLHVPVLGWALPLGALGFVALSALVVTGTSNAVNLTDGLDGLAGGCALAAVAAYLAVAAVAGDPTLAAAWGVAPVAGAAAICPVLGALGGALCGFLVYNRHPARVFMGDTGSLPLGGALAVAALVTKQELLLVVIGGVFVAEALSVIAQVASFKLTGRRVLRCAPLHHHFEFAGWKEVQIVGRFHAAALALAALGVVGLGATGLLGSS